MFEPSALWSLTGSGAPPDFARDRDVVYAPHVYSGSIPAQGPITRQAYEVALNEAKGFGGAPVLVGEWGGDPDRAADPGDPFFSEHGRLQTTLRVSATLWTWRESCGDPHKVGDLRAGREAEPWGEFEVDCATNRILGPRRALIADLTRGALHAAPGRVRRESYDPASGRFVASGRGPRRAGPLVAFHPRRRVAVSTDGLRRPRLRRIPGGGLRITARPDGGPWRLLVRPLGR